MSRQPRTSNTGHDPSIENEPHMRSGPFQADLNERIAAENVSRAQQQETLDAKVEHSVWDEPGLSPELAGAVPQHALTYAAWLQAKMEATNAATSWGVTLAVASVSGLCAVAGALFGGGAGSMFGIVMMTIIGPLTEEVMKTATALWVVEKHPYLFKWAGQIVVCGLISGFVFAVIENVFYTAVILSNPEYHDRIEMLLLWRWTVCVALHVGCTTLASIGLARIWRNCIANRQRPSMKLGSPYLIAAVVIHGIYNGVVVFWEAVYFEF